MGHSQNTVTNMSMNHKSGSKKADLTEKSFLFFLWYTPFIDIYIVLILLCVSARFNKGVQKQN